MQSKIIFCLAGLVSGIVATCEIPEGRLFNYLLPLGIAGASLLALRDVPVRSSRHGFITVIAASGLFFLTGYFLVTTSRFTPVCGVGVPAVFQAKVVSYRELTDKLGQVVIRVRHESSSEGWVRQSGRMVLTVRPDPEIRFSPGDLWQFGPITLTVISSKPTKTGFVPGRYWLSRGIRYEARLRTGGAIQLHGASRNSLPVLLANWQSGLSSRIDRIPLSPASRSLIKAMVLGDRKDVDGETMTDFSRAGIIHVLSVSGLHVGIIYFIVAWLLRKPGLLGARIRSLLCLAAVWLYAGVTGGSTSALRSAGMITLFELARMGRRGTPGLDVLASTAVIHCLIDPYTVFSAGAQLSYLAVAGIFIWNPIFNPVITKANRIVGYFAGAVTVSISAQSLITPLLVFWFGWFPLYFLIGNVVLMPVMVFCFYLGSVITVADYVGVTIPLVCRGMDLLIRLVSDGAGLLGNLPGNLIEPKGLIWCDLVLYYLIVFAIRAYAGKPKVQTVRVLLSGSGILLLARLAITQLSG